MLIEDTAFWPTICALLMARGGASDAEVVQERVDRRGAAYFRVHLQASVYLVGVVPHGIDKTEATTHALEALKIACSKIAGKHLFDSLLACNPISVLRDSASMIWVLRDFHLNGTPELH
jgi:hypothetical protein